MEGHDVGLFDSQQQPLSEASVYGDLAWHDLYPGFKKGYQTSFLWNKDVFLPKRLDQEDHR